MRIGEGVLLLVAYLVGGIPFGLLLARCVVGVDVRRVGSGNVGATNVLRAAGPGAAAVTLLLDSLKGWAPIIVARGLGYPETVQALAGLAAVTGHIFPIALRFRGGKGVATGWGVLMALDPVTALLAAGVWVAAALISRYSSVAALVASIVTPPIAAIRGAGPAGVVSVSLMTLLILWRHRSNIVRLRRGEESRIHLGRARPLGEDGGRREPWP